MKPLVVSLLGRKSGGGLELPVKALAGQRAGVLAVTEAQSLSVKSVSHLSSVMKAEMFIQWDHLNVTHFFLVRAGDRTTTEILLRKHGQQHTSTPQSEP